MSDKIKGEVHLRSSRVKKIEEAEKCYYSDVECWRNVRPYEGSVICTNCLLAKLFGGFHPELIREKKEVE